MPAPIFLHPLAYLIGLEGVALMRAFAGEYDREFTLARLQEVRRLLDEADILGEGQEVPPTTSATGYATWSQRYDGPGNSIFAIEEAIVLPILDSLPAGVAIDAGCGTGRLTAHLQGLGHDVRGFDSSPDMLELARAKLAGVRFDEAELGHLPLEDASVDTVTCALALAHVEDLGPVFAEFSRVLRGGGHLVISDTRGQFLGSHLYPCVEELPAGGFGYIPTWRHSTAEYLRAALDHGFEVRDCQEPPNEPRLGIVDRAAPEDPAAPPEIWNLHSWVPEATYAAQVGQPAIIVWHFQLH